MNIQNVLAEYDSMFGKHTLKEIEGFLLKNLSEARFKSEHQELVTLLNEAIGFYRDTTQKEKAIKLCSELIELLGKLELEGSIPYATSLLNIANAFRAFGLHREAMQLFEKVEDIYGKHISKEDFMYASLYNNWALAYQESGAHEKACEMLKKALKIVDLYKDAIIPQATTRTNLAGSLLALGTETAYTEAVVHLSKALDIFEKDGGKDFHYSAALVAMGDAYSYKEDYVKAAKYYEAGMEEIEKHTGKNENYVRVLEKYEFAEKMCKERNLWQSNLEKSKNFYETYGRPMIENNFPEYAEKIAVGLVGEGSDCFGFDDEISADHDYAPGFCMWLTEEDYLAIGKNLQQEYDKLIKSQGRLEYRRGVFSVNQFYNGVLETACDYEKGNAVDFDNIKEHLLATAVNGAIFRDDLGVFSNIRKQLLNYYPENVWRKKLAQCIHEFSQYAQSNYSRMMVRKDAVTAFVCVAKGVESALDLVYLLERKYAPYYKWKKKGIENSSLAKQILPILNKIAKSPSQANVWEGYRYSAASVHLEDANVALFEEAAKRILDEMVRQNLVSGNETFLEYYIPQILNGKDMDMIDKVIAEEWSQFDKVENEGGRADCQDDYETFSIMRKAQYMTWSHDMLESFYHDFVTARENGWNLITEKYARMMQSTNPLGYARLEKDLPVINEDRIKIQEEIIKIQVGWMEDFAKLYPKLSGNMRTIRTSSDTAFNTSYETYLRGELCTYSEKTMLLYASFIIGLLKAGRNLAIEIMGNTAKLYGFESLKEAENRQ